MKFYWINSHKYTGVELRERYIKLKSKLKSNTPIQQGKTEEIFNLKKRPFTSLKTSSILFPPNTPHSAINYVNFTKKIFYKKKIELKFH